MDRYLAKNLNIPSQNNNFVYSELEPTNQKLNLFNEFIKNHHRICSSPEETKKNLMLYFQKHFSEEFLLIPLEKITLTHLHNEVEKFAKSIFTNGKGMNKYDEKNEIVEDLMKHVNYALEKNSMLPNKNLFSLFSEAKDLPMESTYNYFSTTVEKLARIYQANYHQIEDDSKIFPLGAEKKLSQQLHEIVKSEFSSILNPNKNLSKEEVQKNIMLLKIQTNKNISHLQLKI